MPERIESASVNSQDAAVDAHVVQARHAPGAQRVDARQAQRGEREADGAAGEREQDAFGEQLPQDAGAARAERRADRHLLLARHRARQQQVRHVRAGDEQDEPDRAGQHQQRRAHVADDFLLERDDVEREAAVRGIHAGMLRAQPRRDAVHLRLRPADRHARLQLADDVVVLAVADLRGVGRERQRQQDLGVLRAAERRHDVARQVEAGRENADDR